MKKGQIIHSVAGTYDIVLEDNSVVRCTPRGKLRLNKISPITGDKVLVLLEDDYKGSIEEILPRKNSIVRPAIANIDQMVAVLAPEPEPNYALFDRILVIGESLNLDIVIVLNKADLYPVDKMKEYYSKTPYTIIIMSAMDGLGKNELEENLVGKVSVLSGQSGVGKSSIINCIRPEMDIETQEISKKRGFGRHTTRTVKLIKLPKGGLIADTPGFNRLDLDDVESEQLMFYYPEMHEFLDDCKFRNCKHQAEPGCAVKEAVEKGQISQGRYRSYLMILEELTDKEKRIYQ
jgi:ribosome biogenesis GTPase